MEAIVIKMRYSFWITMLFASAIAKEPDEERQNENYLPFVNGTVLSRSEQCTNDSLLPNPESQCCGVNFDADYPGTDKSERDVDMFPWFVFLISTFKQNGVISVFTCEGALINHRYVLTSASCVYKPCATLETVNVTLAKYGKDCGFQVKPDNPLEVYPECLLNLLAENVTAHEYFQYDTLLHDIALVRLKDRDLQSIRNIAPICLPTFNIETKRLTNLPLTVAGWDLAENIKEALQIGIDKDSFIKQASIVFHVPNLKCFNYYPNLSRTHICAASVYGDETLDGISGSPLMIHYDGIYYVIGVFSASKRTDIVGEAIPSLYTNVYRHILWIKRNMKD